MSNDDTPKAGTSGYQPPVAESYDAPRILIESVIEQDVLASPPPPPPGGGDPGGGGGF